MLNLDQLRSDWLVPESEEEFSLPALTTECGVVQAAWGVSGVQNWIVPPTGMATPTVTLFHEVDGRIRRFPQRCEYRWRAYELERRGHGVESALRIEPQSGALVERLRFEHAGTYYLAVAGLPRTWNFASYWNLPPEDVPMITARRTGRGLRLEDNKTFGAAEFALPGEITVHRDLVSWLEGEPGVEHGRLGVAKFVVAPDDELVWTASQGCEEELARVDPETAWRAARVHWEELWQATFRADNAHFSGHLPAYSGEFERLYSIAVLSLLLCRRRIPKPTPRARVATGGQCIWNEEESPPLERAYVWGGPEGGMTTSFLWELELAAPVLARLDPAVLRDQLDAMMRVDLDRHWGLETVRGGGAGMAYGVNPGAFLSAVREYVQVTGDREWALERVSFLERCSRPGFTDYGSFEHVLECVDRYEHGVASFNALAVEGLRFLADLTGQSEYARQAERLARDVLRLYENGPFACLMPDGERRVVRSVLDFVYVGRCMEKDLPDHVRMGMLEHFDTELRTEDWLYALSPRDEGALSASLPTFQSFRGDHQATGSYDGWAAGAAGVLLRLGDRSSTLAWLRRIQDLTSEGPFGQAHVIRPEGARKASFFNGNGYFNAAGSAFAAVLLDDLEAPPAARTIRALEGAAPA